MSKAQLAICIESKVDVPTVSRWLGHKDGGVLAMNICGHLRREHSVAQAQKVSFASVTAKQADVNPFMATACAWLDGKTLPFPAITA